MMRAPNTTPDQRLTDEQVEALAPYGTTLRLEPGDYLFDEKSVVDSFYVLLGVSSGSPGSTARRRRRS